MSLVEHENENILYKARENARDGNLLHLEKLKLDPESLAKPIGSRTLGTIAAQNGNDHILRFLRMKGVDLLSNVKLPNGGWIETPLFVAVCNDKQSTVKLLLDLGADPCKPETSFANRTPVHQTILKGNKPLLELIWAKSSSFIQTLLPSGALTIVEAMPFRNSFPKEGSLFDFVLDKFSPQALDVKDAAGLAAVHHAAQRNLKDHMRLLLRRGSNPLLVDATGQIPLEIALTHGFGALAQYLNVHQGASEAMARFQKSKQELADTTHNYLRISYLRILQVQAISVHKLQPTEDELEAFYDAEVAPSIVGYVAKHFSIEVMRQLYPALHPVQTLQLALRALALIDEAYFASQKGVQPDLCRKHSIHIDTVLQYITPSFITNTIYVQQATSFLSQMNPEELEEVSGFLSSEIGLCWTAAKRAVNRDVGYLLARIALQKL